MRALFFWSLLMDGYGVFGSGMRFLGHGLVAPPPHGRVLGTVPGMGGLVSGAFATASTLIMSALQCNFTFLNSRRSLCTCVWCVCDSVCSCVEVCTCVRVCVL